MSEHDIIQRTGNSPVTVQSMMADFLALGLTAGMTVLVHSSLSSLGWVCGGAVAVIQALQQTLTPAGTLIMPTHSGDLSDPAEWQYPPVPEIWWETIRQTMPAFNPQLTPSRGMGVIPECFRGQREVLRSAHPQYSFAAWGKHAPDIVNNHQLAAGLGEGSPLARIYRLNGWVLLLGVSHHSNTSLHLAEYRASYPGKKMVNCGTPVDIDGQRRWVAFQDLALNSDDFTAIGAQFDQVSGLIRRGQVGRATAQLMPQRELVDFAVSWMNQHRA